MKKNSWFVIVIMFCGILLSSCGDGWKADNCKSENLGQIHSYEIVLKNGEQHILNYEFCESYLYNARGGYGNMPSGESKLMVSCGHFELDSFVCQGYEEYSAEIISFRPIK